MKALEIQYLDTDGTVLWEAHNIRNVLHNVGQQFILNAVFLGGGPSNTILPSSFFFGLDNRPSQAVTDTMSSLVSEPTTHGYTRQSVSATNQFAISLTGGSYQILSPILTFSASGGSWGPVTTLFLTDKSDNSGSLIASVALPTATTVAAGQTIAMKMGLSLQDIE